MALCFVHSSKFAIFFQADNIPEANHQSPDYNLDDDQVMWDPSILNEEKGKKGL